MFRLINVKFYEKKKNQNFSNRYTIFRVRFIEISLYLNISIDTGTYVTLCCKLISTEYRYINFIIINT